MANAYLQGVEISASQFLDIFHHYDSDGNGYIEGKELQNFIRELQQARKQAGLVSWNLWDTSQEDKMKAFVEKYEQNADGKIGIIELVQILPTEENFLLFFRQQLKSCAEFMEAWRNYDADHSGYIEADELKYSFLRRKKIITDTNCSGHLGPRVCSHLINVVNKIPTYKSAIMALSDGGKLYRTELALVLCAEEM
uniref:Calbindin n=1 Tax=Sinocyclocheilus grahami TaxID=75366 RepID=A0A672Q3B5_SINGR